ncbi:MAG: succinate dehydrogenase cytochrome b subunit [Saprospiraceae bacterium]|nr:succinate dehydrogenase cytochrome b subunit [Saprospiraceae bacterium]
MYWILRFFRSSLGRKFIMALTGLFLIVFLKIHLIGNSLILLNDNGEAFRGFVEFMESNPLIKVMSIVLMSGFIIHIIQGIDVWITNRRAKGVNYSVSTNDNASFFSKYMFWFGVMIFIFLVLHLGNFWYGLKITHEINDTELYDTVIAAFKNPVYVIIYELGIIALHMHLRHGFQSAFQTIGLNHGKWTPFIKFIGLLYSIIVPLGFL